MDSGNGGGGALFGEIESLAIISSNLDQYLLRLVLADETMRRVSFGLSGWRLRLRKRTS